MRIAIGPVSPRVLTRRGAVPNTLVKSLRRSSVARRTASDSCGLSTSVTELLIVTGALWAAIAGELHQQKMHAHTPAMSKYAQRET